MNKDVNIYQYSNLSAYLQDYLKSKESNAGAYSFRSMSTRLKKISYSQLYQVISGKKKFPLELANDFSKKILRLNRQENRYFQALVEVNHQLLNSTDMLFQTGMDADIKELEAKLNQLRPLNIQLIDFDEMTVKPLTMILFILIGRNDITSILQITPKMFYNQFSEKAINEALKYLNDAGYIQISKNGSVSKVTDSLMSKNDAKANVRYHQEVAKMAHDAVEQIDPIAREFQSYVININKADMPKAKELIRMFMQDFAKELGSNPEVENATYNLNVQFFPITKE